MTTAWTSLVKMMVDVLQLKILNRVSFVGVYKGGLGKYVTKVKSNNWRHMLLANLQIDF